MSLRMNKGSVIQVYDCHALSSLKDVDSIKYLTLFDKANCCIFANNVPILNESSSSPESDEYFET